jgi:imidazolonepropionase-like amidohydrolase
VDADLGTIEEGKLADFVVVTGDPFDVKTLPDRIESVWKAGARVVLGQMA